MKKILLMSACAFAFGAQATSSANADISGTLSGDYFNLQGHHWVENHARLTGVAAVPLDWNDLSLQGSAQYEYAWGHNFRWNEGTFALTPFWTGANERVALSVGRTQVLGFSAWNAGAGAEYFLSPDVTLAAKGGVWWGTARTSGGYVGGQATYYWDPNLALSGSVDYSKVPFGYDLALTARAEYLVADQLSIYGGYMFDEEGHSPAHILLIGFKLYCDGNGTTTLVDNHRRGPVGYISTFEPLWFHD